MAMTKAQQEYSIARIAALHYAKIDSIKGQYYTPAKKLSHGEKWELVTSGKVKPTYKGVPNSYVDWYYIFDFSEYESDEVPSAIGEQLIEEEIKRFQRAKDEIMLGDAYEAMSIVSNY